MPQAALVQEDVTVIEMQCVGSGGGTVNACLFQALVPKDRPAEHYTPRITAYAPDAKMPLEDRDILWAG